MRHEANIALRLISVASGHLIDEASASVHDCRNDLFVFECAHSNQVLNTASTFIVFIRAGTDRPYRLPSFDYV